MKRIIAAIVLSILACAGLAAAQNPPPLPIPAPELKKLDYFAGTRKSQAEMMPPGTPVIHMSGVDHNGWMPGNFFLVIRSTENSRMLNAVATGYMGYDPADKVYTMDIFNSLGDAEHSKGTVEGNKWVFTSTKKWGDKSFNDRYTISIISPTSYRYKLEIEPEGSKEYSTIAQGVKTKVLLR